MNKRMRELQALMAAKAEEAKGFMEGENKDIEKANALLDEIDALQKEFDTEERIMKASKAGVPVTPESQGVAVPGSEKSASADPSKDSIKAFADAARNGFKAAAGMTEGSNADGGYTVPADISTQINTLREGKFSFRPYIASENVTTNKGSRTYKTRNQATGFQAVGEGAKIGQIAAPKFSRVDYSIKKYAGYLPVTNELLEDSDAAIANTVMQWLADEGVATENNQILAKINTLETTPFAKGLDDIKKAVNVTLSNFKGTVRIFTNDEGIQWLDTLKKKSDSNEYLLTPDPKDPMQLRLAVGARSIEVVQVPTSVLNNFENGDVPFIVGDLNAFLKMFDRNQLTITQSNTASVSDFNAFEQDMTLFRGIMRADFQITDNTAVVLGSIPAAVAAVE